MKKLRIIERQNAWAEIQYVIQEKHFLFKWFWVDASINSIDYAGCVDSFATLEEARSNIYKFSDTSIDRVIESYE